MFNKLSFNRNAFNRSVSSEEKISIGMSGAGSLTPRTNLVAPLPLRTFAGTGALNSRPTMQQNLSIIFAGESSFVSPSIVLRTTISGIKFTGIGTFVSRNGVRVPIAGIFAGSGGIAATNRIQMLQHLTAKLSGDSSFVGGAAAIFEIHPFTFSGQSSMQTIPVAKLMMVAGLAGAGTLELRRMGELNETAIELLGINLLPGETVVIDTDALQVLLRGIEDVSAVTTNSVFFELNPGENEITFSTDITSANLDITAIWQNRWL